MKSGKLVLSALAGIAVGAIVGVLLAPEKGSKTRRKLLDKGEGFVDDLKEKITDYLEIMKDKVYQNDQVDEVLAVKKTMTQEEVDKIIS